MAVVDIEKRENIGVVTLNRAEVLNALNGDGYLGVAHACEELSRDEAVNAIVIQGAGRAFCAGSDISEFQKPDVHAFRKHYVKVAKALRAISKASVPVIAKVHGYALGGGCGIVAACDLAVASDDTVFGLPERDLDIFPTTVMPAILGSVGRKKAFEMLFTGNRLTAAEAVQVGLINRAVPSDVLDKEVFSLASIIAGTSSVAIRMGKEAYLVAREMNYFDSFDYLYNIMAMIACHDKAAEKINRFLEQKKAKKR